MAAQINRLNARVVKAASKPGRYSDGANLYLSVSKTGAKSWVFFYKSQGRQRELGLGSLQSISLAKARELAGQYREKVALGEDPRTVRKRPQVPTFGECADAYVAAHEVTWSNPKHVAQWKMTLKKYAAPIRSIGVDKLATEDILKVLKPIWQSKPETASRLRGRIEAVLNAATANGQRTGENPARWVGNLKDLLPNHKKTSRGHFAALAYKGVAAFMADLRGADGIAARALELTVLTAARSGEVLGATWEEVDFEERLWTVPAARMKTRVAHRVPLSEPAVAVLRAMQASKESKYVFSGSKPGAPLSSMAMAMVLRRLKYKETVHGFRSAFRDWASEETSFPHHVCEMALAHAISSDVEKAYRRGDLLEKRRELMEQWASQCAGTPSTSQPENP